MKKKIKELCVVNRKCLLQNKLNDGTGPYPVIGAKGVVAHIDKYMYDKPYVGVIKWGDTGRVFKCPAKTSILGTIQGLMPVDDVDYTWFYYCIKSLHLEQYSLVTLVPNLYFKHYSCKEVNVPSKDKQIEIGKQLSKIDELIYNKKQQLQCIIDLNLSRFNAMFLDKGLDKYETTTINEVAIIKHGKDYKQNVAKTDGYPIYGSGGFMGIYANNYLVKENSIIIGRKGTVDKPIFVNEKFWNIDTAFGIEPNLLRINPIYLFYRLKFVDLKSLSKSTARPSMTKTIISAIRIGLPPMEEQQSFCIFVQNNNKIIKIIKEQIEQLNTLLNKKLHDFFGG